MFFLFSLKALLVFSGDAHLLQKVDVVLPLLFVFSEAIFGNWVEVTYKSAYRLLIVWYDILCLLYLFENL